MDVDLDMKLKLKWAEVVFGTTVNRYTLGIDSDNVGFDQQHGSFLIEGHDGSVTSYWNCPVKMYQEPDRENFTDFDKGWEK